MIRSLIVLAFVNSPALSYQVNPLGGDTLEIRESSEGHMAEVLYVNSEGQRSNNGEHRLQFGDVVVICRIGVDKGSHGAERLTVIPQNPAYMAIPDVIDVIDGESVVVQIVLGMF